MKKNFLSEKKAMTVIVAMLLTGFLLIIVSGVANFVIREMQDTKAREQYLQAFAMAEGSMELGLKKIKDEGFYFSEEKKYNVLGENGEISSGNGTEYFSYNIDEGVTSYDGKLEASEQVIFPLFHKRGNFDFVKSLEVTGGNKLAWNIIGYNASGISGTGNIFNNSDGKGREVIDDKGTQKFIDPKVGKFLEKNGEPITGTQNKNLMYLSLFNLGTSDSDYSVKTDKKFTKPVIKIISSAKVGTYKQNIQTEVDYSKMLGSLKYSIVSE